jgi:hypothetical protein
MTIYDRRQILELFAGCGLVFASGVGCATRAAREPIARDAPRDDFFFLQLSDTHWGYRGPANPDAGRTLPETLARIDAAPVQPEFIVLTGDLTHSTDDPRERRRRLGEVKEMLGRLRCKAIRAIPGEHDAALDSGEAYREVFGPSYWSFDLGGIHFVGLDNVSDGADGLGDAELAWLEADLARVVGDTPIVVFAHRPLFDLAPSWDWDTRDGARALAILEKRANVTVFYGHIHQEHRHMTGAIAHLSARSLIFPMPAPMSVEKKAPLPWEPASGDHGLGHRLVSVSRRQLEPATVAFGQPSPMRVRASE